MYTMVQNSDIRLAALYTMVQNSDIGVASVYTMQPGLFCDFQAFWFVCYCKIYIYCMKIGESVRIVVENTEIHGNLTEL